MDSAKVRSAMSAIINCRNKWGTGYSGTWSPSAGSIAYAANHNDMMVWLQDVKSRSGYTGTVINDRVSAGTVVRNLYDTIVAHANAIYNHCRCNCDHCACNCQHCSCNCQHCSCNSQCSCNCNNCCNRTGN